MSRIDQFREALNALLDNSDWPCDECGFSNNANAGWCESPCCVRERIYHHAVRLLEADRHTDLAKKLKKLIVMPRKKRWAK